MQPYAQGETWELYHGDNEDVIPALGLDDVHLVFTSPPYNLGVTTGGGFADVRKYEGMKMGKWSGGALAYGYVEHDDAMPHEEYVAWQHRVLKVLWDCLADDGAIYYNHKPRPQATGLKLPLELNPGLPLRQIVIWKRAGGVNFAPTHYVPTHEWILVLAKEAFRLKSKEASGVGDVWDVPQETNTDHPAPFPIGLPARAIESVKPRVVLDPFVGSGTTLRAAFDAGVPRAIGIDRNERYLEKAVERMTQASLFAPSVPAGVQEGLF